MFEILKQLLKDIKEGFNIVFKNKDEKSNSSYWKIIYEEAKKETFYKAINEFKKENIWNIEFFNIFSNKYKIDEKDNMFRRILFFHDKRINWFTYFLWKNFLIDFILNKNKVLFWDFWNQKVNNFYKKDISNKYDDYSIYLNIFMLSIYLFNSIDYKKWYFHKKKYKNIYENNINLLENEFDIIYSKWNLSTMNSINNLTLLMESMKVFEILEKEILEIWKFDLEYFLEKYCKDNLWLLRSKIFIFIFFTYYIYLKSTSFEEYIDFLYNKELIDQFLKNIQFNKILEN